MDFFIIFLVLFVAFFVWQYNEYKTWKKNQRSEMLVKEFFSRLVSCKIEKRDGQYFLYDEITQQFLAQGRTADEVYNNLPKDNRFYMSMDGRREILEELYEIEARCMQ